MTDADAIRAAIAAIADEAHPAAHIRATLDAHARRHRQRRLVLRTAGALAAASVAGAGGLAAYRRTRPEDLVFPPIAGGPGGGWLTAGLGWRPTWLPAGYGRTSLGAVVDGSQVVVVSHEWGRGQRPGELSEPFVALTAGWSDAYAASPQVVRTDRVELGGASAEMRTYADDGGVLLTWQPATGPRLSVSAGSRDAERDRSVAVRIAKSLRPDTGTFAIGPKFGWQPASIASRPWMYSLGVVNLSWVQNLSVRFGEGELTMTIGPRLEPLFDLGTGRSVDVGGGAAWLDERGGDLFAKDLSGRDVQLSGDSEDLPRVLRELDLGPVPDMGWYGTR
ncbi:hypothetical protein Dvina_24235 [Dactylosporangium vinaceum]|uniref:Uncharacterized protein n=1 Tax=Dactylosporangium vinaceum TaxID=53362 RepID=A0ABV5MDB2_9ACTN|nr:hypothetical protein [Dactylosporangium vinaceum]UAC00888.1 hypothetical protein Dvina_24235 [Dactylosporangium vinaceum]